MATYFSIPSWEIPWTEEPGGSGGLVAKLCPTLETSWTIARQAPLFVEFSRQEPCSGLPFASPGIKPGSLVLQADSLPTEPAGKLYHSFKD